MANQKKYVIGCDFGTLNVRSVLFDVTDGSEIATSIYEYKNKVIDDVLPGTNIKVPLDGALQDPKDYEDGILMTITDIVKKSKVSPEDIIGIGTDFTSTTIMPVKEDSTPLCYIDKFRDNPHSWVKIWKDHSSNKYAHKVFELAKKRKEKFLARAGGIVSAERFFPKTMLILDKAEEIYNAADLIMNAGDWIVLKLTGNITQSIASLPYDPNGTPSPSIDFWTELDPRLKNVYSKLKGPILNLDEVAGYLTEDYQKKLSLPRIPVTAGNVDATAAVPACKVVEDKKLVLIMGTSTCHFVLSKKYIEGFGIGARRGAAIPHLWCYGTGQSSVGDLFDWFVKKSVPPDYYSKAKEENISIHDYLSRLAAPLKPGESGLLAIDWFNGNRLEYLDADLSGLIMGMNLSTKPEEIYRAYIEATAFGTRHIIETFEKSGVEIDEVFAAGGLPNKNKMLMQIYSDILNKSIKIAKTAQPGCLGSAIFASVGSGYYSNTTEAVDKMAHLKDLHYSPIKENIEPYNNLYKQYKKLYDYFGTSKESIMKILKDIKMEVTTNKHS